MHRFTVRPAAEADLDVLSALLGATWHATYDAIYGAERVSDITARWHAPAALARGLGRSDAAFLVAAAGDGPIAGTASISMTCGGTARLDRLYVHPSFQGRGIGAVLLEAALSAFPEAPAVRLEVEPANTRAIAFYERHGFRPAGRTGDCGGSGDAIEAIVMERPGA